MKLDVVSDIVATGNRERLDPVIEALPDLFIELIISPNRGIPSNGSA